MNKPSGKADVRMRGFGQRTPIAEAVSRLDHEVQTLGSERVPLTLASARLLVGRVLAADLVAPLNVPHFARAAMDGFAVHAKSTFGATPDAPRTLTLVGDSRPGADLTPFVLAPGQAMRVATGAPVPQGTDAVLRAELARVEGDVVYAEGDVPAGKHVGAIGEDIQKGSVVLTAGRRLRPQDLGVVSSLGIQELDVHRSPRVTVLVTGNEVLPVGSEPRDTRIADANGPMLAGLLDRDGAVLLGVQYVPDDRERLRSELLSHAAAADVILVTGGSSVGPEDHAPLLLAELGELMVHGVALRPASPAGFGRLGDTQGAPITSRTGAATPYPTGGPTWVFLLPGNPVSALCAYEMFAGPATRRLGGRPISWPHRRIVRPLGARLTSEQGRTDFVRVAYRDGKVFPIMTSGASILSSTTRADGIVIVDETVAEYGEGSGVSVLLFDGAAFDE